MRVRVRLELGLGQEPINLMGSWLGLGGYVLG